MTDKQTSAAERAALEHLARHKELGIAYSDSAHIGIFLAGVKWAAPKWISVREGLPEECALVLGYREIIGTLSVVFLSSQGKWMFAYEPEFASDITHWMPLPAAPKEEK